MTDNSWRSCVDGITQDFLAWCDAPPMSVSAYRDVIRAFAMADGRICLNAVGYPVPSLEELWKEAMSK